MHACRSTLEDPTDGPGLSTNPYAQDLDSLAGKVLRLNLDGSIPSDNPFAGQNGKRGEIWAYGLRNPFRFGFDPRTRKLWLGDVGQGDVEELDIILKGKNYSWPHCEGDLPAGCRRAGEVAPIFTYRHIDDPGTARAIIGGGFAGTLFGKLSGDYFYGDLVKSRLYRLTPNPTRNGVSGDATTFVTNAGGPVDIVFGPDGGLYFVSHDRGDVRRIGPSSGGDQPLAGRKLLLKQSPIKALQVLGKDAVALGLNPLDDPTLAGGTLEVSGTGFDDVYELPALHWAAIGKPGAIKGFKYADPSSANGPISLVQILNGKLVKAIGKGDDLGHTVGSADPSPVDIVLTVGTRRYCMDFGGTAKLVADKRFTAIDAPAPGGCPSRRARPDSTAP